MAGKINLPKTTKYMIPAATRAMPIGVTLNKPKASKSFPLNTAPLFTHHDSIRSFNKISGLEPTRVRQPPIIPQNPMGIRILDIGRFNCLLILVAAGKNKDTAPIFCIKLEMEATVADRMIMIRVLLLPANLIISWESIFIRPALSRPAPIMITAIIETTAFEPSPLMASSAPITPVSGRMTIINKPTTSTRTNSKIKSIITNTSTNSTIIISTVIVGSFIMIILFLLKIRAH